VARDGGAATAENFGAIADSGKEKAALEPLFQFLDAVGSTALLFFQFLLKSAFLLVGFLVPDPKSLLVSGYPGHHELLTFRDQAARSFSSTIELVSVSCSSGSAVRILRPRHSLRLGPLQQGGCQQASLLARGPKAQN